MDIRYDSGERSLFDPPDCFGFVVGVFGLPATLRTGRNQPKLLPQRLFFTDEQDALCCTHATRNFSSPSRRLSAITDERKDSSLVRHWAIAEDGARKVL